MGVYLHESWLEMKIQVSAKSEKRLSNKFYSINYKMDSYPNNLYPSANLARPNLNHLELLGKGRNRWQYLFF